ncbi:MAG: TetR/AcrR family transcriptional regulator [Paludibacteraceae bacterium]|nr:TetR/AcrR family transcriptional regulator [Paludibacteraceae bacterium]
MENLRQNILRTAETEFLKYGIRSVSIDDICNTLHISKKTFYTEFRQKEELIMLVLESISERNSNEDREYSKLFTEYNAIDLALAYRHPVFKERTSKYEKFMRDLIKYYPDIHGEFLSSKKENIKNFILNNVLKGVKEGFYRAELEDLTSGSVYLDYLYNVIVVSIDLVEKDNNITKNALIDLRADTFLRMVCNEKGLNYYEQKNKIK